MLQDYKTAEWYDFYVRKKYKKITEIQIRDYAMIEGVS